MRSALRGATRWARLATVALAGAATVSACGSGAPTGAAPTRAAPTSAAVATPDPSDGVVPVHLALPSIGVSAAVAALGETPQGDVQAPPDWDTVGWFSPGYRP